MNAPNASLGLDVGGSHVTAGVVGASSGGKQRLYLVRRDMDSLAPASAIVAAIGDCIADALGSEPVGAIGIAFPGPFNYQKGVCEIRDVGGKFEQMFGLHVGQALQDVSGMPGTAFRFFNDAHCFAVGARERNNLEGRRTVFLTLGSGFGSAFMEDGRLLTCHHALPESCAFYNEPFGTSIADDYFSTRWFVDAYQQTTGHTISGVRELAEMHSEAARGIFNAFGTSLGAFLRPWLESFECDELVIGGNIAKAGSQFLSALKKQIESIGNEVNIVFCDDSEACILTGAARLATLEDQGGHGNAEDPGFDFDMDFLVERLRYETTAAIDGFEVDGWEAVRQALHSALTVSGRQVFWYDIEACMKAGVADPGSSMHGFHSFDHAKIRAMRPDPSADLCIVYGTGAALCGWTGKLVSLDSARKVKPAF
ncbi:MAG: hypothetical protein BGO21_06080 [Dyadobacter sp. 50-39]|uniref:ROK family protein n=1 Tax=Dyadobacter sp. 50-39 TaxID=1895756 RepID=UPI000962AD76|nr:ROK family protein [Dyadobacter sp. 50-39]OJV12315.1 MAG: hypothetical protein BGO21_06080 [Dyadobacter sp. 50-39]